MQRRRDGADAAQHQYSCALPAVRETIRLVVLEQEQEENPSLSRAFRHLREALHLGRHPRGLQEFGGSAQSR